ncbi:hypothetical protein ACFORL_06125 [Legionella dresdenensis]|uniref:Uncharacterized protein n=2 Tax=Legionella dresdenensis TaxID=450200 RepID=A0ABV8CEW4_9GAMM
MSCGIIRGQSKVWVRKEVVTPQKARKERLAQEFFRLIIPHQPETRIAVSPQNIYYILSEQINGYKNLPETIEDDFLHGRITGLGQALLVAMFAEEADLKNGNIGIDEQGRVIKIDGDWCFSSLTQTFSNRNFTLTPVRIAKLPDPSHYPVNHWLDFVVKQEREESEHFSSRLSKSTLFRAEINEAMLKICLIPDGYLACFVDAYMPDDRRFFNLLRNHRNQLINCALADSSFQNYLKSIDAELTVHAFLAEMKSFKAGDKQILASKFEQQFEQEFKGMLNPFQHLKQRCGYMGCKEVSDCLTLLRAIRKQAVGNADKLISDFYQQHYQLVIKNANDRGKIAEIHTLLTRVYASVSSSEVLAVRKTAKAMHGSANFFSVGKKRKANNIEKALQNTSLLERGNIISTNRLNKVQEALASHRHWGRSTLYKSNKQLIFNQAAHSYQVLKQVWRSETCTGAQNDKINVSNCLPLCQS